MQILISLQSLIMDNDIYSKEPAFSHLKGNLAFEYLNRGYSNIVKYCTILYAILDQVKNPSKGFEKIIQMHFWLQRDKILETVWKWIEEAQKPADYSGLVASHNPKWSALFGNHKQKYRDLLVDAYKMLKENLYNIPKPS